MSEDAWLETPYGLSGKRVWVAGADGMVGSAMVRRLTTEPCEVITVSKSALDLRRQQDVEQWMAEYKPDVVLLAAAKVGGILANRDQPAEFLYDNLMIETNIVHAAYMNGVEKLLFLGSSCIYPRDAAQPIDEGALLSGELESTNEAYALAKIAGIKLCAAYRQQYGCDYISAMPCNLYGPGDTYDAQASHVIPALIMKACEAKRTGEAEMVVWGSGKPLREFLHVDDLAEALVFLLKHYSGGQHVNIGSGEEISIADLAQMIVKSVGYQGSLVFDQSKPDGTPRKVMDSSRIKAAGWGPEIGLKQGLDETIQAYRVGF